MHNRPTIFIFEIETGGLCKNRLQIHSGEAANAGTAIDADPVLRVIIGAIAIVPHPSSSGLRVTNAGVPYTVHLNAHMHWGTR